MVGFVSIGSVAETVATCTCSANVAVFWTPKSHSIGKDYGLKNVLNAVLILNCQPSGTRSCSTFGVLDAKPLFSSIDIPRTL